VRKTKNAARVVVGKQDLHFFIDVQWALFENDPKVLEMLTREIRRRGGQYISLTGLKSATSLETLTGAAQKRKQLPIIQRKKAHQKHDISSRRPTMRNRSNLSSVGVSEKATLHDVIAQDTDEPQSPRNANQAVREKYQELRTKSLMRSTSMSRRRKMGLFAIRPRSARGVAGRHRAKKDGAFRSKKRDRLKNNRRKKSPPELMEGSATCLSTQEGNRDIAQESCETMCTPLGNYCGQEIPSLPLSHLDTSTLLDDSFRGPASLELSLLVTPPLPAVQGPVEVRQLASSHSLPAENALSERFGEVEDSLPTDVEVDNALTDPQAALPTNYFPIVKPPLPNYPPIWAQVIFTHILVYILVQCWRNSSRGRKFASLSTGSEAIKVAYTTPGTWPEATFSVRLRPGLFSIDVRATVDPDS
jgi:hypothetical protein